MKQVGEILKERECHISSGVFYIQQGQTVATVCEYMTQRDIGAVCVLDGKRFVGLFSERDAVRRVVAKGLDPRKVIVEQVMTEDLLVAEPDEDYRACLEKMQRAHVRHLPVVLGDELVGMLSIRDLLKEEDWHRSFELQALTDYVYHLPPESA